MYQALSKTFQERVLGMNDRLTCHRRKHQDHKAQNNGRCVLVANFLRTLPANAAGELNVLWHDDHPPRRFQHVQIALSLAAPLPADC
jgi:hypothetical protein